MKKAVMFRLRSATREDVGPDEFLIRVKFDGEYPEEAIGGKAGAQILMIFEWMFHAIKATGYNPRPMFSVMCSRMAGIKDVDAPESDRERLKRLIEGVYKFAGRPSRDLARSLRELAAEIEDEINEEEKA